jgi:hypothetical protein
MKRLRFLQPDSKGDRRRVECYLLAPKLKRDKDGIRLITIFFSLKFNAELALLCDDRIKRAFEDCEDLERQISSVVLRSEVENTDIDFYDLPESKAAALHIENACLEALMAERDDGQTYLYFAATIPLDRPNVGKFLLERFGSVAFCEFAPSQIALKLYPELSKGGK